MWIKKSKSNFIQKLKNTRVLGMWALALLVHFLSSAVTYIGVLCVQVYQSFFSVYFSGQCRFIPSCSNYCKASFKQHSPLKALVLSFLRLVKCNPFYRGSCYDPVPDESPKGCEI